MPIELTVEMIVVLAILGVTVLFFITECFRIDFTAILVMISLGVLSQFPGLSSLADTSRLFEGFASNAVISIIAVMIIIVTGLTLAFGDTSGGARRMIQIVFGLSIAFAASSFFLSFFSFGGGAMVA